MVFGFIPECRSASLRNECSASPEFPIGMEHQVQRVAGRRFLLLDGTKRYLVDEELLLRWTAELGGQLVDPLKTTIVQNQRCMTTWVLRKNA